MLVDDAQLSNMLKYHRATADNEYLPVAVREVSRAYAAVLQELVDYRKGKVVA